ncbi:peptide ABC transporter substrate-binding protein [Salinispira pacifica]|uniref:Oligopeptide ABC transporter, periplasmic oligopeptide-binding protein OppA n=1 Tax=Salinispira pacifica TaxID=1307761 RepID=V5WE99_9SPIO|nr:peptide ABC transporter substrate-binding protein [Salinispira pacifica]AHC14128.1 Oligopeptide ABC transporter, periplasmic oligopeptide-binding protein OppA [Salinispira pacifica]
MKRSLWLVLFVALTVPALLFTACGGDSTAAAEEEEMVLNWNLSADPKTIDPGLNGATDGGDIIANTFEGLVRERNGEVYPGIAESWEFSEDGKTVTFNLRESKWSDGSDLTAQDFVYAWKRAMAPETASEYSWIWEYTNVVNAPAATVGEVSLDEVGIRAVDDYTLEVQLSAPTPYFISLSSFYHFMPVKQSAVEAGPDGAWAKDPDIYVSNGPFVVTEYTIGDGLVLEQNPNFWDAENVEIDRINVKFIDEASTAYTAYNAGEFDFLNDVPPAEVPKLIAENPEFYVFPLLGTYYYNFNMDLDMWDDARIRRALTLSIDREQIVDVLARGNVPAPGFVPPGFPDHMGRDFFETAGDYGIPTDDSQFEEAQELLAEAGYEDGEGFPEFTLMYNTSEGHKLVAEMVQEMWKTNLGIDITLENQEWAVFQETRKQGDYEVARGGWITDFLDPSGLLAIFTEGNAYNDPNFNNDEYNAAMARALTATTDEAHYEALYEAQDILMNELPIIPVYHYTDYMLSSPAVKGWERSMLSGTDFRYATVER